MATKSGSASFESRHGNLTDITSLRIKSFSPGYSHEHRESDEKRKKESFPIHPKGPKAMTKNPSAVTTAFRELQDRAKSLETETQKLRAESDHMSKQIDDLLNSREARMQDRSANRLKASEALYHIRDANNKLRIEMSELDTQLIYMENDARAVTMATTTSRSLLAGVEDDVHELKLKLKELVGSEELMRAEINRSNSRVENKQEKLDKLPAKHHTQRTKMLNTIKKTEEQINILNFQLEQQQVQCGTVTRYMEMLLSVNDEICNTVLTREEAKSRVLRLSGRVNLPSPRKNSQSNAHRTPNSTPMSVMPSQRMSPPIKGGMSSILELADKAKALAKAKPDTSIYDPAVLQHIGLARSKTPTTTRTPGSNQKVSLEDVDLDTSKVPFNEVMKIISARAARHVFKSQRDQAKSDARLLLQLTSGGAGAPARSGNKIKNAGSVRNTTGRTVTPTEKSIKRANRLFTKANDTSMKKRRSGKTKMSMDDLAVSSATQDIYEMGAQKYQYAYDSATSAADVFAETAARSASERPLSAPVINYYTHDNANTKRANKQSTAKRLKASKVMIKKSKSKEGSQRESEGAKSIKMQIDEYMLSQKGPNYLRPRILDMTPVVKDRSPAKESVWMPQGRGSRHETSHNIVANATKVIRTKKINRVNEAKLNHYNSLHKKEVTEELATKLLVPLPH